MPSRDKESYSIQAVENALDVLEALSEEDEEEEEDAAAEGEGAEKE